MATTTITLPTNFATDLASQISSQFSAFSTYVLLIMAILGGLIVVEVIISTMRHHK